MPTMLPTAPAKATPIVPNDAVMLDKPVLKNSKDLNLKVRDIKKSFLESISKSIDLLNTT